MASILRARESALILVLMVPMAASLATVLPAILSAPLASEAQSMSAIAVRLLPIYYLGRNALGLNAQAASTRARSLLSVSHAILSVLSVQAPPLQNARCVLKAPSFCLDLVKSAKRYLVSLSPRLC